MTDLPLSTSGRTPLEVAIQAAEEGGRVLRSRFGRLKRVRVKSRGNLVTDADIASEAAITTILNREYPGFNTLCEESGSKEQGSPFTWVVDPLDGTNNFTFGIPHFAITLALVKEQVILAGLTYDPLNRELFHAERGKGARLNGTPLSVSDKTELRSSLIGFDMGYSDEKGRQMLKLALDLWPGLHSFRLLGSAALGLAYAACGRLDIYFHRYLFPWDICSGILLVKEAGGEVTDWSGQEASMHSQEVIASSPVLRHSFMEAIDAIP